MTRVVMMIGVDREEANYAGYGIVAEDVVDDHDGNLFELMFGEDARCEMFNTFSDAMAHVAATDAQLVDVVAAIAY